MESVRLLIYCMIMIIIIITDTNSMLFIVVAGWAEA